MKHVPMKLVECLLKLTKRLAVLLQMGVMLAYHGRQPKLFLFETFKLVVGFRP
ncbi:hypothetical protein D3C84_1307610 [compost metagenome]